MYPVICVVCVLGCEFFHSPVNKEERQMELKSLEERVHKSSGVLVEATRPLSGCQDQQGCRERLGPRQGLLCSSQSLLIS